MGEEPERSNGPNLNEAQWDLLLRKTGFSGLDGSLPDNIDDNVVLAQGSAMFSTATKGDSKRYPKASLLLAEELAEFDTRALKESLIDVTGNPLDVQTFNELSSDRHDGTCWIVLALEGFSLLQLSEGNFAALQSVMLRSQGVLWVTRGARGHSPEAAMIDGLVRVVRSENAAVKVATLDLDDDPTLSDNETASIVSRVYAHVFAYRDTTTIDDLEFVEKKGIVKIRRVLEDGAKDRYIIRETQQPVPEPQRFIQENRSLCLKLGTPGLLDSIYFEDNLTLRQHIADEAVEVEIKATGVSSLISWPLFWLISFNQMNFKDVMIGLGQIPYSDIGLECSGVVTAIGCGVQDLTVGDRVCGLSTAGYSSYTRVHRSMVARIPDHMSFTAAASIPVVFCTAYYSLVDVARLIPGESVLIHAAAGGVGQAAIMIAQHVGQVEIFVTVGSLDKKALIIENYGIAEDHIFSSRDTTFEQGLRDRTRGRGVDVILNSLAGDALSLSWRQCLAPLGRFIEIGKRDLAQNNNLEMEKFMESVTFAAVDLGLLASKKPKAFNAMLNHILELHEMGALVPVSPITTYSMSELQKAMRLMQSGKHMGKVVITAGSSDVVQVGKITLCSFQL